MAILFDKQKKPAQPTLLGQASNKALSASPAQTSISPPKPMYDFSNDGLVGSQVMMQERGTQPPVSGANGQEVAAGINANISNELARMLAQVKPSAPQAYAGSPASVSGPAPAAGTPVPASSPAPAAYSGDPASLVSQSVLANALANYSSGPILMGSSSNASGGFVPASVSSPSRWTSADEASLTAKANELAGLREQEKRAGVTFGDTTSNLERAIAGMLVRRQNEVPDQASTTGLSDQDFIAAALRDQIKNSGQNAYLSAEAARMNEANRLRENLSAQSSLSMARQNEIAREYQEQRDKLVNSLAARGLTAGEDSYADAKLSELKQLYKDKASAEAAAANVAILADQGKASDAVLRARNDELTRRDAAIKQFLDLLTAKNAAAKTSNTAMYNDRKLSIEQMYKEGLIDYKQRDMLLKEAESPSEIAKNEATAANLESQAEYRSGAQTDKTQADTRLVLEGKLPESQSRTSLNKAKEERIYTLLPAELAKMKAQASKLVRATGSRAGGSASYTQDELAAVYKLNGGKAPTSDKMMAQLLNQVRVANGNVEDLVTVQDERAKSKAAATRKPSNRSSLFGTPATAAPAVTAPKPAAPVSGAAARGKLF